MEERAEERGLETMDTKAVTQSKNVEIPGRGASLFRPRRLLAFHVLIFLLILPGWGCDCACYRVQPQCVCPVSSLDVTGCGRGCWDLRPACFAIGCCEGNYMGPCCPTEAVSDVPESSGRCDEADDSKCQSPAIGDSTDCYGSCDGVDEPYLRVRHLRS